MRAMLSITLGRAVVRMMEVSSPKGLEMTTASRSTSPAGRLMASKALRL